MTPAELSEIWKRWERSTPGEWQAVMWIGGSGGAVWGEHFPVMKAEWFKTTSERTLEEIKLDLEFAAHAHQDIPALRAHIDQLTAERDALREALQGMVDSWHGRIPAIDHNGYDPCDCKPCRAARQALGTTPQEPQ